MIPAGTDWHSDFQEWLRPFLAVFKRSEQRCWAPVYLEGLTGPGARKSVEPMAERVCPGQTQQLHHFVSTSTWPTTPLEQVLRKTADALVGGKDAALIVDDTALPKQGKHSVGVKRQHCGVLGKQANCQVLVSLTRTGKCQCQAPDMITKKNHHRVIKRMRTRPSAEAAVVMACWLVFGIRHGADGTLQDPAEFGSCLLLLGAVPELRG